MTSPGGAQPADWTSSNIGADIVTAAQGNGSNAALAEDPVFTIGVSDNIGVRSKSLSSDSLEISRDAQGTITVRVQQFDDTESKENSSTQEATDVITFGAGGNVTETHDNSVSASSFDGAGARTISREGLETKTEDTPKAAEVTKTLEGDYAYDDRQGRSIRDSIVLQVSAPNGSVRSTRPSEGEAGIALQILTASASLPTTSTRLSPASQPGPLINTAGGDQVNAVA